MSDDRFIRVLSLSDLPPGGGLPVEVGGRLIAVFNDGGAFHAIENECPHKGASLADGALDGGIVTCPMHRWQFRLNDGKNPVNSELCVRRFPVEIREGAIWVDPN